MWKAALDKAQQKMAASRSSSSSDSASDSGDSSDGSGSEGAVGVSDEEVRLPLPAQIPSHSPGHRSDRRVGSLRQTLHSAVMSCVRLLVSVHSVALLLHSPT